MFGGFLSLRIRRTLRNNPGFLAPCLAPPPYRCYFFPTPGHCRQGASLSGGPTSVRVPAYGPGHWVEYLSKTPAAANAPLLLFFARSAGAPHFSYRLSGRYDHRMLCTSKALCLNSSTDHQPSVYTPSRVYG